MQLHFLKKPFVMNSSIQSVIVSVIFFISQSLSAQQKNRHYEFGLAAGIIVYQGDLTPKQFGSYETMKLAVNLSAAKIISSSFSARANLIRANLRGDDAIYNNPEFRKQRNFNFTSPVTELSLLLVYNPLGKNYSSKGFSPYLFSGAGVSFFNIKRDHSAFNAAYFGDGSDLPARIAEDDAQTPPGIAPVVPIGAGIRYNLSERWAVNAESSYRLMFTDYLDGFSQAANPSRNDHYQTTTVGIIYRTGAAAKNKNGCPTIRY
jgi:OOP family OmpA-OmpF porin